MKIQIVSDLHLEFLTLDQIEDLVNKISNKTEAEIIILAGDICSWSKRSFYNRKLFIDTLSKKYKYVLYVLGNHEYYDSSYSEVQELKSLYTFTNIIILENKSLTIEDVTFYGTTLWFEETVQSSLIKYNLNDYRCIKDFTPDEYCREAIKFIKGIEDTESKKVLITHHIPHSRFVSPKYVDHEMNCFYLTEIGKYLNKFDLVVFGHSHDSVDQQFSERTLAMSNPRGYLKSNGEGENDKFNYRLIIDV